MTDAEMNDLLSWIQTTPEYAYWCENWDGVVDDEDCFAEFLLNYPHGSEDEEDMIRRFRAR